jgi:hypothetical protein
MRGEVVCNTMDECKARGDLDFDELNYSGEAARNHTFT